MIFFIINIYRLNTKWDIYLNFILLITKFNKFIKKINYHPLLSASPLQTESVRTLRSINFFQSIPSLITLNHSLQTSSAAHSESASRYERMLSATWSNPFSVKQCIILIKIFITMSNFFTPQTQLIFYLIICLFI